MKIHNHNHNPYQPPSIPPWMTDSGLVAPCPCGDSLNPEDDFVITTNDWGAQRWWHPECIGPMISMGMIEDDE